MENFTLEGTDKTPFISMNAAEGKIEISGRSNPENARELYSPVVNWLDDYLNDPAEVTELKINLEHFNTSTSKYVMEILRRIRIIADADKKFRVVWMYEDDDEEMLDTAEAYEMMTGLRFEKVGYPEQGK